MEATGIDERRMVSERIGADFLVFFYEGEENPGSYVDSLLLTNADLPAALAWVRDNIPTNACWSLGVITSPTPATTETEVEAAWIIGADVLNLNPDDRSAAEERVAREMLARRDSVDLLAR